LKEEFEMIRKQAFNMLLIFVALSMVPVFLPGPARADDTDLAPYLLARKNKGPILWYIRDEEKKKAMEEDIVLLTKFNEAEKAHRRRNAVSSALFYPGAAVTAIGVSAGLFQNTIGLYDEDTGMKILMGSIGIGIALMTPGIVFRAKKSKAEKEYERYIRETYDIIPILKKESNGDTFYALNFRWSF
jgi:hypothetical protein